MGVHDYFCFIHSNGEQCLNLHNNCTSRCDQFNKSSNLEESEESHNNGGSSEAVLIMFDKSTFDPKTALKALKEGNVRNIRIKYDITYSRYDWDFIDKGGYMGYQIFLTSEYCETQCQMPWKVNNDNREIRYRIRPWVICVCMTCYTNFLSEKIEPDLCSMYVSELLDANRDISDQSNSKKLAYKYIRRKYRWLRHIIRSYEK